MIVPANRPGSRQEWDKSVEISLFDYNPDGGLFEWPGVGP